MTKRTPPGHARKPQPIPQPEPVPQAAPTGPGRRIPHGLYHVSWAVAAAERQERQLADLETVARLGMVLMHASHLQDEAHTRRFLDRAAELGVGLLLEDVHPSERQLFAGHPALAAYSVADDANTLTPERLRAKCDPAAACGVPRYLSIGASLANDNAWCYGHSESIGVQLYPYPDEPLSAYWPILTRARELATANRQQLVANLQLHTDNGRGWPTPVQVRALGLMAAAAGVDAVLWYALLDTPAGAQVPPDELLAAAAESAREASQSLPARLDGGLLHAGTRVIDLRRSEVVA